MTPDEYHASARGAAGAREARARFLACARDAGPDPASLLANVAAVRASSAGAAQPENPLSAASRRVQNALAGARPAGAGRCNRIFSRGFRAPGDPAMTGRHHAD
jgi:hypothetical protein